MLKLNTYSSRDLQIFFSMLVQFESEGVTDLRLVRSRLHDAIYNGVRVGRVKQAKPMQGPQGGKPCPDCGQHLIATLGTAHVKQTHRTVKQHQCRSENCSGVLIGPYRIDNIDIMRCSVKCGYSEVV